MEKNKLVKPIRKTIVFLSVVKKGELASVQIHNNEGLMLLGKTVENKTEQIDDKTQDLLRMAMRKGLFVIGEPIERFTGKYTK